MFYLLMFKCVNINADRLTSAYVGEIKSEVFGCPRKKKFTT